MIKPDERKLFIVINTELEVLNLDAKPRGKVYKKYLCGSCIYVTNWLDRHG